MKHLQDLNRNSIMKLIFKWLITQVIGSLIMSLVVCYVLIGKVKGFYEPGYEKVFFFLFLFLCFSLLVGLPILLFWFFLISQNVSKNKIINLFLFIGGLTLSLIFPIFFFT